jgi:HK97 family phage portal protein
MDKIKTWLGGPEETRLSMVSTTNGFYAWQGDLYRSDIIRACLRPFYKSVGKLVAKQVRENGKGELMINPDAYVRILLEEPNPYMTGQMLQERLAIQFKLNNNAFAFILRDEGGYAKEIYPLNASGVQAKYDKDGVLFLEFTMRNGQVLTFYYSDVIHLRQDFGENDVFGSSNAEMLKPLMEVINTTDQGMVASIKNSASIRWLLKFKTPLSDADRKKQAENFSSAFLASSENATGVAAVDSKADAEQIHPDDKLPNAAQMDRAMARIYNIFGTNEAIVQSKYNEDQWNAYYESEIEPFATQFSHELTRKIFSRRERAHGNRIVFEAASLQYASMNTKLQLVQMVDRGSMTPNEWRRVLNLGPIEDGDTPIRRLDTAKVTEGGDE